MSNLTEIKQSLGRLAQLRSKIREQFARFSGPEGEEMKKKAKKEGTRMGIGAGISFFGLIVAAVSSVYLLAVIILLVNIALDKLWLSALIVVGGFLLIGVGIIAVGVTIVRTSAKELSETKSDVRKQIKQAGEEMKAEVGELQKIAKIAWPAVVGAYIGYRIIKRKIKSHREKRLILKVIKLEKEA